MLPACHVSANHVHENPATISTVFTSLYLLYPLTIGFISFLYSRELILKGSQILDSLD